MARRPDGLVDALSFRLHAKPWSKRRALGYEDWYLVRDFRSLGVLNDAAVAYQSKRQHDDVARDAIAGAGGVYKLLAGKLPAREARLSIWMRKPRRTPYPVFLDDISRLASDRRTALWRRQMALSPAPEFCLHSELRLELPGRFNPAILRVQVVGAMSGKHSAEGAEGLGES